MHLIVNLNLAMDRIIELSHLISGTVHRSQSSRLRGGGKGVNVARALKALGEESTVVGFLGGPTGEVIRQALDSESINCVPVNIKGNSRTCYIIRELDPYAESVINEPGPLINPDEFAELEEVFSNQLRFADSVILTGSLPPGVPDDTYRRLIHIAAQGSRVSLLDTVEVALAHGLAAEPSLVKINEAEAAAATHLELTTPEMALLACRRLQVLGAKDAMVTRGPLGAVARFDGVSYSATGPNLTRPQSVGSGDAVLAGIATGIRRGFKPIDSFKLAVATGTAAAESGIESLNAENVRNIEELLDINILE
jgi:1-phosphofructokinase family hexose kinase